MKVLWLTVFVIIVTSCRSRLTDQQVHSNELFTKAQVFDTLRYARGFSIHQIGNNKLLTVSNPWQKAKDIQYHYLLTHDSVIRNTGNDTIAIHIPVKSVVCLSTTHIAMIDFIGQIQKVVGVSSGGYFSNNIVREKIKKGKIKEVGFNEDLNFESIVSLQPDVVFIYGVSGDVLKSVDKLTELGIKVVYVGDYLEDNPLGKMEWVKFMAAFFDCDSLAGVKYDSVVQNYNRLKKSIVKIKDKPKVLLGLPWKGTWYVTGENTFAASLIRDAGGVYLWRDLDSRISEPMGLEIVYARALNADYWLNPGVVNSRKELAEVDERFRQLPVFVKDNIYNNNKRVNTGGGNDYWESGIVKPDVILADMIRILHPGQLVDHELYYYKKIE